MFFQFNGQKCCVIILEFNGEKVLQKRREELIISLSNLYFDGSVTARPTEHFTAGMEWSIGSLLDSEQCLFFEINRRHCSTSLGEIDPVI